jgi:beta-1,4-mannosyl-glycoprotein beta-1,4-N-acetylglucosaminyltransferase
MRVFDCCLMFNELDLLEIRLHTHTWADVHVIVESPRTFSNLPKPITLDVKNPRFAPFTPKIRHIISNDLKWPQASGSKLGKRARMELNGQQWEQMRKGLKDAKPDDVIVLTDLDEMLRPEAVAEAVKAVQTAGKARFAVTLYAYSLNGLRAFNYRGPVAYRASIALAPGQSLWKLRCNGRNDGPMIGQAGWHFTSQGSVDDIITKLKSAAHTEYDRFLDDKPGLVTFINEGRPMTAGAEPKGTIKYVPVDATFPPYLRAHVERFKHLLRKPW